MRIKDIPSFLEVVRKQDPKQIEALIEFWQNGTPQDETAVLNGKVHVLKTKEEWITQRDIILPELLKMRDGQGN